MRLDAHSSSALGAMIRSLTALGVVLAVTVPGVVRAAPESTVPTFAVQIEGGALRTYRTSQSADTGPVRVSDDAVDAAVAHVTGSEWELTITPKTRAVAAVWFPWEPDPAPSTSGTDDAVVYYPTLLGVVVRDSTLSDFGWRGGEYPGQCFAPLVIVATETRARLVAATNWPPRRVKPMYSRGRIGLRYDERLETGSTRTYRTLVASAESSSDFPAWQAALDAYKTWLKGRLGAAGMSPQPAPWMRDVGGWLNVQLQNMPSWDARVVEKTWARWGRKLAWVQFWGQMSPRYVRGAKATGQAGCCLQTVELDARYRNDLPALARRIAEAGHVGFYARPRAPYAPLVGPTGEKTADFVFLHDWLEHNRSTYGANAFYVDVLGHRYFGEPGQVAALLRRDVDPATVIEYPVDVYPTAFLVSGSLGGGNWQGGPGRTPSRVSDGVTQTTFPSFGRYLLDDRILFLGESNGDGRWWGPGTEYWTERQAFLLGAKFDVIHPTEDGEPDGPDDRALVAALAARDRSKWWDRDPVYLDRRGLGDIPVDVDVRRYRGRQGETLLVVDNWQARSDLHVTVDGRTIGLPDDRLAIVTVPRSS